MRLLTLLRRRGFVYLLRDLFTTDRAAGSVHGTTAEPGPGTRSVTDTGSNISISNGKLRIAGGTATWGQTGYYATTALDRRPGRVVWFDASHGSTSGTNPTHRIGVSSVADAGFTGHNELSYTSGSATTAGSLNLAARGNADSASPDVAMITAGTTNRLGIVLRMSGRHLVMRSGQDYIRTWVHTAGNANPLYVSASALSAGVNLEIDAVMVENLGGAWLSEYGPVTDVRVVPTASELLTHPANGFVEFTWTPAASETLNLIVRRLDDQNAHIIRCVQASGTIRVYRLQSGVETELTGGTTTQTWTAGTAYILRVRLIDGELITYVNNTQKNKTTAATVNQTATGMTFTGAATARYFVSWPYTIGASMDIAAPQVALGTSDQRIRFLWMTDSHNTLTPVTVRDEGMARAVIDDAIAWKPQAVIHTGDAGNDHIYNLRRAYALLRDSRRPWYSCIGNHDEHEATTAGVPNTTEIASADVMGRSAPFYHSTVLSSGDGTVSALCLFLDCNFYDNPPSGATVGAVSANHTVGQRIGYHTSEPSGGYHRQLGAAQRAWVEAQLAATTANMVLVFTHYPPSNPLSSITVTDYRQLADLLQARELPAIGFCGHTHADARSYTLTSTDAGASYTFYKTPAMQESGAWARVTLSMSGGSIVIDELGVKNFTNPGSWVINAPFTVI